MSHVYNILPLINNGSGNTDTEEKKEISQKYLVNKLNYLNFQDGTILINLKHTKYNRVISLNAKPKPCLGDQLDCLWTETTEIYQELKSYEFENFLITYGRKSLLVKSKLISINEKGISLRLPETCYEITSHKTARYLCENITVQLIQNSAVFSGSLVNFNVLCFHVEVAAVPPQTFQWINPESPVYIVFSNSLETIYSGNCKILKQTSGRKTRTFVLEPLNQRISRFKPKEFPSIRQQVAPSPDMVFRHPLTGKIVNLKIFDISGSGFSVEEDESDSVLLPGMIIPKLELMLANTLKFQCEAQVVSRTFCETEKKSRVKCGLVILDMDIQDHVKLLAFMQQAKDSRFYLCAEVDMDALWNFFFETGFIYPEKYAFIQANKEEIKETYRKLYTQHPNIARHFIYQDKGVILGHMAMLRFYENTWLIHHHAANTSASNAAGLAVLNQIGRFINDSHYLYSIHLNFIICYFRPENRFPNHVFGGAARNIGDPKACSLDPFAYFHYQKISHHESDMPKLWELTEVKSEDLLNLESFYEDVSGGLMIQALDLAPGISSHEELSKEYQRLGFKKERNLYALKKDGSLKAIIMVSVSDIGLNMSDLTNCIKVIVLDQDGFSCDILYSMLSILSAQYVQQRIPVLLYPVDCAENHSITYEKIYNMWIAGMEYTDHYFRYFKRLVRTV